MNLEFILRQGNVHETVSKSRLVVGAVESRFVSLGRWRAANDRRRRHLALLVLVRLAMAACVIFSKHKTLRSKVICAWQMTLTTTVKSELS